MYKVQARLIVRVGATVWYCRGEHVVVGIHARSLEGVGAATWKEDPKRQLVTLLQVLEPDMLEKVPLPHG